MTKTNIDLQPIRKKLQMLKAELPAAEALSSPWSAPRSAGADSQVYSRQSGSASTQPRVAIETLQQRSGKLGGREAKPTVAQVDSLVAHEIQALEVRAHQINVRSQQQTADIMAMKRAAQQATVALARQGIYDHPQLAAIAQLFENDLSAVVPHVERDTQGYFVLTHAPVDFQRAEQEAIDTADALRSRQLMPDLLFDQPIAPSPPAHGRLVGAEASPSLQPTGDEDPLQTLVANARTYLDRWLWQGRRRGHRNATRPVNHPGNRSGRDRTSGHFSWSHFSWLDGAIWFSGAAIARIVVEAALVSHPILRMPLLIALVGAIALAIYRVVFAKSSDFSLAYRLSAALLGLFLGGSF